MPGYGNPISDPLNFGLSAGGPSSANFGPPTNWIQYGPGGAGSKARGDATTPTGAGKAGLKFDISSGSDITNISNLINSINQSAQKTALQNRIPNNPALEAQSSANIGAELQGQVQPDVIRLLQQQAAERGVGTGVGGDAASTNAAYLQALGLTSIGQMKSGQQDLSAADARNPAAPIFDPSKLLMTPEQLAATNLGYLSEADRTRLEQEQLALEAARAGGGGGRGGYGSGYGGTSTGSSPYQYQEPGIYSYGAPSAGTLTGSNVFPTGDFSNANWLASLGITSSSNPYAAPSDYEAGAPVSPTNYGELFGPGTEEG
jgi:hypothetical protein